jgi:Carboxypeptidase regulatory-like domain/TonB-dependent Receptor Plug Domain
MDRTASAIVRGERIGFWLAIVMSLWAVPASDAQRGSSTLLGRVTDPTGAVVAGATVTSAETRTGITRSVKTNDDGEYTIPALDVGEYKLTVEQTGFKSAVRTGILLEYEQKSRVDMVLELGQLTEAVTVVGNASVLHTDDAVASTVIDDKKVRDLPLDGRNFIQLAQLVPGTTPGSPGNGNTSFAGEGYAVSANGQRDFNNNYTLDGVNMTETRNPAPAFLPSVDALQEFNVLTGLYSAEYGTKAGAQVNIALKSGSNGLHGSVYEFHRNSVFDARNFFNPSVSPLKRNQFGGTLGGPIRRNRTFFFVAFDGTRERRSVTQTGLVPDPNQLQGNFSALTTPITDPQSGLPFPGNAIADSRIDSRAKIIRSYFPAPTNPGQVPNYIRDGSQPDDDDQGFVRIDHKITEKDNFFGRYAISNRQYTTPAVIDPFGTTNPFRAQNISLQEVRIFNPHVINQFQFGYNRFHREITSQNRFVSLASQLAIPGVDTNPAFAGFPVISIQGYTGIGEYTYAPLIFYNEVKELKDTLSIIHGSHSLKAGADILRIRNQQNFPIYPRGSFSFSGYASTNPIADFLLGLPLSSSVSGGLTPARLFTTFYNFFVTDDWKATPNLTINLGLRYEANMPVQDQRGLARNLDITTGDLFPDLNTRTRLYRFDDNNFAPRLSFAYRPLGSNHTVIRGGAGVFYSVPEFNTFVDFNLNPPLFTYNTFQATTTAPLTFANPFPLTGLLPSGAPTIYSVDRNAYRDGFTLLWSLSVQRQLASDLSLELSYVGSKTTGLLGDLLPNQPNPGPGNAQVRRRWPQYGNVSFWTPNAFSTYHSLEVKAERRFSHGLFFLGSYTFSKAIDLTQSPIFGDGQAGGFQSKYNIFADKGPASFDLRQRFSLSYGYELPFGHGKRFGANLDRVSEFLVGGWQINGITAAQSGSPFSLAVPGDPAGIAGNGTLRPNRLSDGRLDSSQRTLSRYFDTSAFVAPPPYTFGNSGRDILTGPGLVNFDFSVFKNVAIHERTRLQFRVESFNLFNTTRFNNPGRTLNTPSYGVITSAGKARELQFALKVHF